MPDRSPARNRPALLPALLVPLSLAVLGGCSDGGAAYPSLASRPAERLTDTPPAPTATPSPAIPDLTPSPELAARIGKLIEQARSAKRDFDDRKPTAEKLATAAGSAPSGSEEWARATQALSGVESARSRTAQPLSELDRLDVDDQLQGAKLNPTKNAARGDPAAIARARETISGLVAEEDEILAKLDGKLAH